MEENLPTGWGQSSNRTDFYKVPLIAVASVILAIGLVTIIFMCVLGQFNRMVTDQSASRSSDERRCAGRSGEPSGNDGKHSLPQA